MKSYGRLFGDESGKYVELSIVSITGMYPKAGVPYRPPSFECLSDDGFAWIKKCQSSGAEIEIGMDFGNGGILVSGFVEGFTENLKEERQSFVFLLGTMKTFNCSFLEEKLEGL